MEKRKIKKGNDFIYLWSIVRNGLPENLADAAAVTNRKLYLLTANDRVELTEYSIVDGNIVRIEFTPEIAAAIGDYRLELSYTVADDTLADKGRKCAVDTYAFTIVARSADVDVNTELAATSEIAIGLTGKKGDPFLYSDFTPEQLEALKVKGDPFTYADFTPEQLEALKQEGENPNVIDMRAGEYLMDIINTINALPEAEKPTVENPLTINFYNHSKTIDWSRYEGIIQFPEHVYLNFIGTINAFDNGDLFTNEFSLPKMFLGFSFARDSFKLSGLPQDLKTIPLSGKWEEPNVLETVSELNNFLYSDLMYETEPFVYCMETKELYFVKPNNEKLVCTVSLVNCNMANSSNTTMQFTNNQGAVFGYANNQNAYFGLANNQNAYFGFTNNQSAIFNYTNNQRAYFGYTNNQGAKFAYTNNQGAYFGYTNNQGASFIYANLKQVDWDNVVSIVNANFRNADLTSGINLPERINTKAKWIAECGAGNVNAETIWIDGTSILS